MKLKKDIEGYALIMAAKKCTGDVIFQSAEGDILNLKSVLSQYLFVTAAIQADFLSAGRVECTNAADYERLSDFLVKE